MKPIIEMEGGESMRLERISEELELDAELMGFLDRNGLRPDAKVEFVGRDVQAGVMVLVNGSEVAIGSFAAERLFVSA